MVFPIVGGTQSTGYDIDNSLRFNDGDSPRATREFSADPDGDRKTFTISFWAKRSTLSSAQAAISAATTNNFYDQIIFASNDGFEVNNVSSASDAIQYQTNAKLRDVSAWYHIVVAMDTTQASASNGIKIYINGVLQTSFATSTYNQNATFEIGRNGTTTSIGRGQRDSDKHFDGYLSEVYFIAGAQKAASDFGETNDNGVWIPKEYTGTYGTNGFKLEFKETGTSQNSSGIGADTSGNDQHFAVTNLAAGDVTTDTPTNNFCTINPIDVGSGHTSLTISEGNTKVVKSSTESNPGDGDRVGTTMKFTKGKWYWEEKAVSGAATGGNGIYSDKLGGQAHWHDNYGYYFDPNGNESNSGSQIARRQENDEIGYGSSAMDDVSNNDIIMCALDLDNNRWYIGVNGQWSNNNAASGGTATANSAFNQSSLAGYFTIPSGGNGGFWGPFFGPAGSTTAKETQFNFGNPPFSISSSNADANGYGNFEYAVPSGYYSMCTKNLAEYG